MISAVILTKNNESIITKCLASITWVDEVIIVDDNSSDNTKKIAQNFGATVYSHELKNDFSQSRNFGLAKATGDWVLYIDSDEIVTDALQKEIKEKLSANPHMDAYYIARNDYFMGQWLNHGETANLKLTRLGRKGKGKWTRIVHEKWQIKGQIGTLNNSIMHYPHPTISEFLKDINFYTTLHANVAYAEGKRTNFLIIIFKPKLKFLLNYIFRAGFLDGISGFIFAIMMSFHSFLTQAKLWQLQQNNQKY